MPQCLSAADLVIGRAGAMTLTEIEAKAKASILIPSPNVAENHQFHNAMALVRRGAAEIIEEKDLTGEALWEKVRAILSDPGRLAVPGGERREDGGAGRQRPHLPRDKVRRRQVERNALTQWGRAS